MSEYIPSPRQWVAEQVELYEGSGGTAGLTLRGTGVAGNIVTHYGRKTRGGLKTPLIRMVAGRNYFPGAAPGGGVWRPGVPERGRR